MLEQRREFSGQERPSLLVTVLFTLCCNTVLGWVSSWTRRYSAITRLKSTHSVSVNQLPESIIFTSLTIIKQKTSMAGILRRSYGGDYFQNCVPCLGHWQEMLRHPGLEIAEGCVTGAQWELVLSLTTAHKAGTDTFHPGKTNPQAQLSQSGILSQGIELNGQRSSQPYDARPLAINSGGATSSQ